MPTAILCPGWPRGLKTALRTLRDRGRTPALLLLPAEVARRWRADPDGTQRLPVLGLPVGYTAGGPLPTATAAAVRAAGITGLLAHRNDGGTVDEAAAAALALRLSLSELLLPGPTGGLVRHGRLGILRTAMRRPVTRRRPRSRTPDGPAARRPQELFDPVSGRHLPRGGDFSGVDARGALEVGPLGFLRIPGMADPTDLEPVDHPRVILLGGSALYGLGLPDNASTIPAGLHRGLSSLGQPWEVLSFGVPGGWSRGESAMLLYRLRHSRPDVVVSLSGWNDFNTLFAMELVHGPGAEVLGWTFSDHHHYLRMHAPEEVGDPTVPFAQLPSVRRGLAQLDSAAFPRSGARLRAEAWLDNQALMAQTCARHGIRFIGALQPHSLLQPSLGEEFTRRWVESHYDFAFTPDRGGIAALYEDYAATIDTVYRDYRSGLRRLAGEFPSASFLDLSEVFMEETEPCLLDGVHPTVHGAARLAEHLTATVARA